MTLAAGQRLGSYEIVSRLAAGGMGEVWLARDSLLKRPAAIKVLHESNDESRRRFLHEARAVAALNHPNIVGIYEAKDSDGAVYIAMELVEGEPLTAKIPPKGLPLQQALDYLIPVAAALETAHLAGIVHRDVKPANVMVQSSGQVKLLDFGLAKRLPKMSPEDQTVTALTEQGQVLGTVAYMSPEQVQGKPVDGRTDIFSFGAMAYELLSGQRPFRADSSIGILAAIVHTDPSPLSTAARGRIPANAENIVMRCLRKDPARRFQTFSDLRVALEDLKAEESTGGSAMRPPRRTGVWLGSAGILLMLAGGAYWVLQQPEPGVQPVRRLTFDGTINITPALSGDGKLLAFASDRGSRSNLDIWLRQTAGGGLVQLTSHPVFEAYPRFSPDNTKVLYLSGSGAIFEVPALGGPSRQVIDEGGPFDVSASGEIAFVKMRPGLLAGPIFVFDGNTARRRLPNCSAKARPSWTAEGKSLLFFGQCEGQGTGGFRANPHTGEVTALLPKAHALHWYSMFAAGRLESGEDAILYSAGGLSRWLPSAPYSVTRATVPQSWPALSPSGQIVFSEYTEDIEVRMLPEPLPPNQQAAPSTIISAIGHFGVSRDGQTLVYGRLTSGTAGELVVRNLITNEERVFASHDLLGVSFGSLWPQVSPAGDQVVYRVVGEKGGIYLLRLPSGEVRRLGGMENLQLASDWSADGSSVLAECPGPAAGICELDPRSGSVKPIVVHPRDQLIYPSVSADGGRLVFMRRRPGAISAIWTARMLPSGAVEPDSSWIRISPEDADCSRPRFGMDGLSVYYVHGRDGLRSLVRQKLNGRTGKPEGDLQHLVDEPMEIPLINGGVGPYPLISVTRRGVFYSTFVGRGHLYTTNLN